MASGIFMPCHMALNWVITWHEVNRAISHTAERAVNKIFQEECNMKNIYEILKEFGLELATEKKAEFEKAWKENYRTKSEYDNAVSKRDEYKTSLDTVNEKLKEFDGVDVLELKGQITKLQEDLKAKDTEYAEKEAARQFDDSLEKAINASGGRNAKAIRALLDIEGLKKSKDQTEDIKKALEAAKESDAYLFGANEPINNPVGATGGTEIQGMGDDMSAIRAAMGLPAKNE